MIKQRLHPPVTSVVGSYQAPNGSWGDRSSTLYSKSEWCETYNNPGWFKGQQDCGTWFIHRMSEYRKLPSNSADTSSGTGYRYVGSMTCSLPSAPSLVGDGQEWGAVAYNRMKPTKFDYSLFNMVYELRELPAMLMNLRSFWTTGYKTGGKKGVAKRAGNGFLEQVFGWNPLINDVMTIIEKQQKLQKRIDWLIRNQGRWVPREVELFNVQSFDQTNWVDDYSSLDHVFVTQMYNSPPQSMITQWRKDRCWATAQFKYFLPNVGPGVSLPLVLRRRLQGFRDISMADLYRAIPWTWLIDWCLGAARILENCDPGVASRIGARRFFIMREQEWIGRKYLRGKWRGGTPYTCSSWRRELLQTRVRGFPFYPGNPNQLSGMQHAILGALALSKL